MTDIVTGLLQLVGVEGVKWQLLNIGSQDETRVIDLARKIIDLSQSKSKTGFQPFSPGDHRRRVPDTQKAGKLIGQRPRVRLEEGLERTAKWAREHRLF